MCAEFCNGGMRAIVTANGDISFDERRPRCSQLDRGTAVTAAGAQRRFSQLCAFSTHNTASRARWSRSESAFICVYCIVKLEIRSVERGICPIATSTMNKLFL